MTELSQAQINAMRESQRVRELYKMTKAQLAHMHVNYGGLMGLKTYMKWTKDELVNTILQDEAINAAN